MELLYVFNESVSAVGEIFAQHLSKAFRSSSPGHQHADITGLWRDLDFDFSLSVFSAGLALLQDHFDAETSTSLLILLS